MNMKTSIFSSLKKYGEEVIGVEKLNSYVPSQRKIDSALLRKRKFEETTNFDSLDEKF